MSEVMERAAKAIAVGHAAAVRSVMLQLELGLVYCRISEGLSDDADAARVHSRAHYALDSALHIAGYLSLTQGDQSEFDEKAAQLRAKLSDGEGGERRNAQRKRHALATS